MTIIQQNGKTIRVSGSSISITNGIITIDGKKLSDINFNEIEEKTINIVIEGNVESLTVDTCDKIEVKGSAKNIKTHNGNVTVALDVTGNISTHNGNVMCGKVGGDVDTHNGNIMHS